jgi:two-component system, OmpR family, sensor histidine kinase CssS
MRNWPIFKQIAITFSALLFLTAILLLFFLPLTLKSFFTNEIYTTIESSQQFYTNKTLKIEQEDIRFQPEELQSIRTVNHLVLNENGRLIKGKILNPRTVMKIKNKILDNKLEDSRTSFKIGNDTVFIVVKQFKNNGYNYYLISYMWDTYLNELVVTLFKRILMLLLIIFVISIMLSFTFAKKLSKPLVLIKRHVHLLAQRKWDQKLILNRKDEIGVLADSIDIMRRQLLEHEKAKQTLMQNVSHDLKTPVMVIQSYAQALQDGVIINESKEEMLEVIAHEAHRLEHKIKDLLYLTKLQHFELNQNAQEKISIQKLLEDIVIRLMPQRAEINWDVTIEDFNVTGNKGQWEIALENIITNCIRYANMQIKINVYSKNDKSSIEIWNDGPEIPPHVLNQLFDPFVKGNDGNFGLGLTIAKKIFDTHNFFLTVSNVSSGVKYKIYNKV